MALPPVARRELLSWGGAILAHGALGGGCRAPSSGGEGLRVVSTSPSMTEMVFALGRGGDLVGRSDYCDEPKEALAIASIGGFANPNLEAVIARKPTWVIGERGPAGQAFTEALERLSVKTFFPEMDSVAQILAALQGLDREVFGQGARAEALTADMTRELDRLRAAHEGKPKVPVALVFDWRPLIVAGPSTFPNELIEIAGGSNPFVGASKYPAIGVESLLALDPAVIIDATAGAYAEPPLEILLAMPGTKNLSAVKSGRVLRLEGTSALRPGPRIAAAVAELSRAIHGGAS